jgi:metal-dependent amidase/aminoacylase/carboxypeptidase family protein
VSQLAEAVLADAPLLSELRQKLHAHPDLCFEEKRTSDLIARASTSRGIPIFRGLEKTEVVGTIRSGASSRDLGLRADMDALPVSEANALPHATK